MAMVRRMGPVLDKEGKEGGWVWRNDVCGNHAQKYPRIVNREPSAKQQTRRRAFTTLLNYIRQGSTHKFVVQWTLYARMHPRHSKKGSVYILAWHQMFISYNINRVVAGDPIITVPPGF